MVSLSLSDDDLNLTDRFLLKLSFFCVQSSLMDASFLVCSFFFFFCYLFAFLLWMKAFSSFLVRVELPRQELAQCVVGYSATFCTRC